MINIHIFFYCENKWNQKLLMSPVSHHGTTQWNVSSNRSQQHGKSVVALPQAPIFHVPIYLHAHGLSRFYCWGYSKSRVRIRHHHDSPWWYNGIFVQHFLPLVSYSDAGYPAAGLQHSSPGSVALFCTQVIAKWGWSILVPQALYAMKTWGSEISILLSPFSPQPAWFFNKLKERD